MILVAISIAVCIPFAAAVTPTGSLQVSPKGGGTHCAPATFTAPLPEVKDAVWRTLILPDGNSDGCSLNVDSYTKASSSLDLGDFVVMVERGNCSFYQKALNAQAAGAKGLIVYNSLEGIYQGQDVVLEKDYECANGQIWVAEPVSPSWSNDPDSCRSNSQCKSRHCVLTNDTSDLGQKACCAWDLYITMGAASYVDVIAAYITMSDAEGLLSNEALYDHTLQIKIYNRPEAWMDGSSIFLWLLAVCTVGLAAVYSSRDLDKHRRGYSPVRPSASQSGQDANSTLELSSIQTVGFIVLASCVLILMFYVNLYALISVVYAVAAASALSTIITTPITAKLLALCTSDHLQRSTLSIPWVGNVGVSLCGAIGGSVACIVAITWYLNRGEGWAWMFQDLFGVCVCVLFLSVVRFPNARVATSLLCLAFVYDVFFVFISPYVFNESVMVKVATGGQQDVDADYCEKYPDDSKCDDISMPMLFIMPRFSGYSGGYSLLGLGDIILPGLLVVFCRRYDLASSIGGAVTTSSMSTSCAPFVNSKFLLMLFGYAFGLMLADIAVCATGLGQPALLYIVPCTLGLLVLSSFRDGTLPDLWKGPRCLRSNDTEVQGENSQEFGQEDDDSESAMIALRPNL